MKLVVFLALACVGLAGCATPVKRIPAANAKLAAQGWEQAATPIYLHGLNVSTSRTLICMRDTCGAPAMVATGSGLLDTWSSFGHAIQTVLSTPSIDSSTLREGASLNAIRQKAGSDINIENIEKVGNEVHVTGNDTTFVNGKMMILLFRVTATATTVRIDAAGGPDRAKAQSLFSLIPLAR
jgi:hypothetical protein